MITLLGYQYVSFDTKDSPPRHIEGTNVFVSDDDMSTGLVGARCYKLFVTPDKFDRPLSVSDLGRSLRVVYNRYGKPSYVEILDK